MFCAAQLREWERYADTLQAIDTRLLVLVAEPVDVTASALARRGIDVPIAVVDPALWTSWGLANPARPELAQPTTFVVDPAGKLIWRRTTGKYSPRVSVPAVLEQIERHRRGQAFSAFPPAKVSAVGTPVLQVHTARISERRVQLEVVVPDGFHIYGRKEQLGTPPEVYVDGEPVPTRVPAGERTRSAPNAPVSYWLHGSVKVEAETGSDVGEVVVQACSDTTCFPPAYVPWRAGS